MIGQAYAYITGPRSSSLFQSRAFDEAHAVLFLDMDCFTTSEKGLRPGACDPKVEHQ